MESDNINGSNSDNSSGNLHPPRNSTPCVGDDFLLMTETTRKKGKVEIIITMQNSTLLQERIIKSNGGGGEEGMRSRGGRRGRWKLLKSYKIQLC